MLKTLDFEVKEFIPSSERHQLKPTTIYAKPLSKGEYDRYQDSISSSFKGKEVRVKRAQALHKIYRERIVKIKNVEIDGTVYDEITDKDKILYFMTHLSDVEAGAEIDNFLLGISSLNEEERKNSEEESD